MQAPSRSSPQHPPPGHARPTPTPLSIHRQQAGQALRCPPNPARKGLRALPGRSGSWSPCLTVRGSSSLPILLLLWLLLTTVGSTGCRSTHFPENPKEHPLARKLRESNPYYLMLANGVFSRVVAIQPLETTSANLKRIKNQLWPRLEPLATPAEIETLLRSEQLTGVADAVKASRAALASQRPADADPGLEAGAVKQGLIEAYYGFFPPTPAR